VPIRLHLRLDRGKAIAITGEDPDPSTALGERMGNRETDAGTRSSYDDDLGSCYHCHSRPVPASGRREPGTKCTMHPGRGDHVRRAAIDAGTMSGVAVPISDYLLIGDTRTGALVAPDGSIDWCCLPRFDAEPVFGRIVGGTRGGAFAIRPRGAARIIHRGYRRRSPLIETKWAVGGGTVTLIDGMVADTRGRFLPENVLVRTVIAGGAPIEVEIELEFVRRKGFAPFTGWRVQRHPQGVVCTSGSLALGISSDVGTIVPGRTTTLTVNPGRPLSVVISATTNSPAYFVPPALARTALAADERHWREWLDACTVADTPFREAALRSLLTLRLLTYAPSGAPVAAPTTSLPEAIGGSRNWDYRYAWPRDGAITAVSMLKVGKRDEATTFLRWLQRTVVGPTARLPPVISLSGGAMPAEQSRSGWPGYAGSRPVRVGNGARSQHQLDGYGWVLDAAHQLDDAERLHTGTWRMVAALADRIADEWRSRDAGIWEVRGGGADFVHSKVMAWVALDRALRLAEHHPARSRQRARWRAERAAIRADVHAKGFDPGRRIYLREYGTLELDAALLVLPTVEFDAVEPSAVERTVRAIQHELGAGDGLVYRYPPGHDGLDDSEGAFVACSFWLAQALARLGHEDEARELIQSMLDRAPLGLFSEEIDPSSGAFLGNYPQAISHAALVQAVLGLRDATAPE
jgi:GH15 family glucan-1,4-alpha-glucosidase